MGFCAILWTMKMLNEAVGKMWRRILMKKVLIYNIILYLAYCCKKRFSLENGVLPGEANWILDS